MELVNIFSALLAVSAVFSFINHRYIKLPGTIGLMALALVLSLLVIAAGGIFPELIDHLQVLLGEIDFSDFLLDFMLGFLLFAGALHIDMARLRELKWPVMTFATVGILISTFMVGTMFYYLMVLFGLEIGYINAIIFGALISPTDPIAVLGIMKKAKLPPSVEMKISGESLFNDGIGVVIFVSLYHILETGGQEIDWGSVGTLFLEEVAGGIGMGLALGYLGIQFMRRIDHYQTEVMLSLAMVMGGYSLANYLHFSGPLAVVVAGLFIGNKGRETAMSDVTYDYLAKFWEMIDEILNAALFVLIGLELLIITFHREYFIMGLICSIAVVVLRYIALAIPSYIFRFNRTYTPKELMIMTWGGLRGGISIALALSLTLDMNREPIVAVTYTVVLFSILVQGLTLQKVINTVRKDNMITTEEDEIQAATGKEEQ